MRLQASAGNGRMHTMARLLKIVLQHKARVCYLRVVGEWQSWLNHFYCADQGNTAPFMTAKPMESCCLCNHNASRQRYELRKADFDLLFAASRLFWVPSLLQVACENCTETPENCSVARFIFVYVTIPFFGQSC